MRYNLRKKKLSFLFFDKNYFGSANEMSEAEKSFDKIVVDKRNF